MSKENNETKICKHCQTEIPKKAKICPNCKKKQGGKLKWIIIAVVVLFLLIVLFGGDDSGNSSSSSSSDTNAEEQEQELSIDELKAQCEELSYKDVARNPDNYVGKYFKVKVYVDQLINKPAKSGSDKHYKAYMYDEVEGMEDYSKFLWLYDFQYDDSKVNILEGDVLEIYAKFEGMGQTQNSITDETSEDIALDVYYVELISE